MKFPLIRICIRFREEKTVDWTVYILSQLVQNFPLICCYVYKVKSISLRTQYRSCQTWFRHRKIQSQAIQTIPGQAYYAEMPRQPKLHPGFEMMERARRTLFSTLKKKNNHIFIVQEFGKCGTGTDGSYNAAEAKVNSLALPELVFF